MTTKKIILIFFALALVSASICAAPKKSTKAIKVTKSVKNKSKKRQYVDLESIDILGLIDRPRTLYIIKKSDTEFKDNFADYGYINAIIEPTYSEPF